MPNFKNISYFTDGQFYENDNKGEAVNFQTRYPAYAIICSTVLGSNSGHQMLPVIKDAHVSVPAFWELSDQDVETAMCTWQER